jgi:pimeloyl-ACP methyl ester carboxylesterase
VLLPKTDDGPPKLLRTLLQHILVGHSFGGLLMRLFAHWYRDEVCALVLVDAMNETQFDVIGAALPQFLRLSSNARQSFALNSGHFVQRDAPEVIVETIRELIATL